MQHEAQNRRIWDDRAREKKWYVDTATDADFADPGKVVDPFGWCENLRGIEVLCLAAGGGRHGVLLAAAGARVTVVDISPEMLRLDQQLAGERGLSVRTVVGSMEDLGRLARQSFDLVLQPVSSCYVPALGKVYRQVAEVLKSGGLYISHHKQPVSLQSQAAWDATRKGYAVVEPYYRSGPLPVLTQDLWHREAGAIEFLHRWEELVGELCRAGFVLEDLREPRHGNLAAEPGSFAHRSGYIPPYVALKARRVAGRV